MNLMVQTSEGMDRGLRGLNRKDHSHVLKYMALENNQTPFKLGSGRMFDLGNLIATEMNFSADSFVS